MINENSREERRISYQSLNSRNSSNYLSVNNPLIDINFIYNNEPFYYKAYKVNTTFFKILKEFKNYIKLEYTNHNKKNQEFILNEVKYFDKKHNEIIEDIPLENLLNPNEQELNIYIEVLGLLKLPKYIDKYIYENIKFLCVPLKSKNFMLFKYIIEDNIFKNIVINEELENYFSSNSSYCNGINELFIYNGENNLEGNFWKINLINDKIEKIIPNIELKDLIFQSLIYIPTKYVFIIGGRYNKNNNYNEDVIYYDLEENKFVIHSKIEENLIEPSLITVNNQYLYAITNSIKTIIIRVNLRNKPIWEEMKIKTNYQFDQKFFGLCKINERIIFIGGKSKKAQYFFEYNYESNEIYNSNYEYKDYECIEKTFIPINFEYYILITPKIEEMELAILSCNIFTQELGIVKSYIGEKKKQNNIPEKKKNEILIFNLNMPQNDKIYNNQHLNSQPNGKIYTNDLITNKGFNNNDNPYFLNTTPHGKRYTNGFISNNNTYTNGEPKNSAEFKKLHTYDEIKNKNIENPEFPIIKEQKRNYSEQNNISDISNNKISNNFSDE